MSNGIIELSVLIPVYNEEKNISNLIYTLEHQSYPKETLEILFIDGGSSDQTIQEITNCQKASHLSIQILNNPYRTAQHAMNIGIQYAKGNYIIRLDAHSLYPTCYFSQLLQALKNDSGLGNVGGICKVVGEGDIGEAYANVLSTMFGVGNSKFRISKKEQYVNTVPFGAFRKCVLKQVGAYNEKLARNEDYELNLRMIRNGYKILLKPDLIIEYQCRNTFESIIKHEISDGIWNTLSLLVAPYTFSISHFIPLFFVLLVISAPFLFYLCDLWMQYLMAAVFLLYFLLDGISSYRYAEHDIKRFLLSFVLYPIHHIGCGIGELIGIFFLNRLKTPQLTKEGDSI